MFQADGKFGYGADAMNSVNKALFKLGERCIPIWDGSAGSPKYIIKL